MEWILERYNTNIDPEMDLEMELTTPNKLTSLCYSYGDKNLIWQYLQKCIISNFSYIYLAYM